MVNITYPSKSTTSTTSTTSSISTNPTNSSKTKRLSDIFTKTELELFPKELRDKDVNGEKIPTEPAVAVVVAASDAKSAAEGPAVLVLDDNLINPNFIYNNWASASASATASATVAGNDPQPATIIMGNGGFGGGGGAGGGGNGGFGGGGAGGGGIGGFGGGGGGFGLGAGGAIFVSQGTLLDVNVIGNNINHPPLNRIILPLNFAIRFLSQGIVIKLLNAGADPNKSDKDGNTALGCCLDVGHANTDSLFNLLISRGADIVVARKNSNPLLEDFFVPTNSYGHYASNNPLEAGGPTPPNLVRNKIVKLMGNGDFDFSGKLDDLYDQFSISLGGGPINYDPSNEIVSWLRISQSMLGLIAEAIYNKEVLNFHKRIGEALQRNENRIFPEEITAIIALYGINTESFPKYGRGFTDKFWENLLHMGRLVQHDRARLQAKAERQCQQSEFIQKGDARVTKLEEELREVRKDNKGLREEVQQLGQKLEQTQQMLQQIMTSLNTQSTATAAATQPMTLSYDQMQSNVKGKAILPPTVAATTTPPAETTATAVAPLT